MKRSSEALDLVWWCEPPYIDGRKKPSSSSSPLSLLHRVADPSVDQQTRECAAVDFNNHIKYLWSSYEEVAFPLPDAERDPIKTLIVPLVLSSSNSTIIHDHLRQALSVIGSHDFPRLWPPLLPDLTSRLQTAISNVDDDDDDDDFPSLHRLLLTLNSLLMKFCLAGHVRDSIRLDLKCCFHTFANPLLETVQIISEKMIKNANNNVNNLIEAQLLCFSMFHSLNFIDLPGFYVKPVDKWMNEFNNYLNVTSNDQLQSAVFENIGLYLKKTHQPFPDYFGPFAEQAVVRVLLNPPLTLAAIKFLTLVTTTSHRGLLSQDHILQQITDKVVIPNMMLRDEDQDLFHKNYIEFIRRDMEDPDSTRLIACRLLKAIVAKNCSMTSLERVSASIWNLLALFAENPATNWKYKHCAISLVLSLKMHKTPVVDAESFFRSAIVPELQSHDVNSFPFLKAAALRFLTKFWLKIPAMDLVGDVVRFLRSDANVVHSYAAIFIKKRLLLRDKMAEPSFALILPVLSNNLFDALKKRGSEENRYVMHCIMRIGAIPKSPCIIGRCTTSVIIRFCENLRHPGRLFEAFDYLVTQSDKDWIPLVPALDIWILPSVRMIVDKHAMRFFPYALRLLARLLDYDTYKVPPHYRRSILDILNMLMVEVLSM
ncbi:hypothetical protein OSB04_032067 [Centaurea solstitialis]|uniref:Importin N-terminal domain-containing protein n=1 Tax=Centaurea solstitialis TaxID=347529 RepID=A0AA38SBZ5_9ASTR|nr:hypothetical protein OSB04_032067 [Centaurea solstitialis]